MFDLGVYDAAVSETLVDRNTTLSFYGNEGGGVRGIQSLKSDGPPPPSSEAVWSSHKILRKRFIMIVSQGNAENKNPAVAWVYLRSELLSRQGGEHPSPPLMHQGLAAERCVSLGAHPSPPPREVGVGFRQIVGSLDR